MIACMRAMMCLTCPHQVDLMPYIHSALEASGMRDGSVNLISPRLIHIHTDLTVRNNVALMSPSNVNATLVGRAVENTLVYNNAIFGGSNPGDNQNVIEDAEAPGCAVENNVAWGPQGARVFEGPVCSQRNANNRQKNGSQTGAAQLSSCPYATCPPTRLQDFRTRTDDPDGLVDGGAPGPVAVDLFHRLRPSGGMGDIGPFELGSGPLPPEPPPATPAPPAPPWLLE